MIVNARKYLGGLVWMQVSVIAVRYVTVGCDRSKMEFSLIQTGALSSPH